MGAEGNAFNLNATLSNHETAICQCPWFPACVGALERKYNFHLFCVFQDLRISQGGFTLIILTCGHSYNVGNMEIICHGASGTGPWAHPVHADQVPIHTNPNDQHLAYNPSAIQISSKRYLKLVGGPATTIFSGRLFQIQTPTRWKAYFSNPLLTSCSSP